MTKPDLHLPECLADVAARFPLTELQKRVESRLCTLVGCDDGCAPVIDRPLGMESGFFVLPAAQLENWGVRDAEVLDAVFDLVYLAHLVYRVEDDLIDAGHFEPIAFLKSRVAREEVASIQVHLVGQAGFARVVALQRHAAGLYARSVRREVRHRADPNQAFTPTDLLTLGDRAAPLVSVVAVMCELADRSDGAESLIASVLQLCTALQLVDDLQDVTVDLEDGNPSWPAKSLRAIYPSIVDWPSERIHAALQATGLVKNSLELAEHEANLAAHSLAAQNADVISEWALAWARNLASIPR